MDITAAYRQIGSYRGAAAICGTTPKTVKQVIDRYESGGQAPERQEREHNYDSVRAVVGPTRLTAGSPRSRCRAARN